MIDDGHAALEALFWRDEILQALYWLHGEGLADVVDAARLAELLVADRAVIDAQLDRLVAAGYLRIVGGGPSYRLTDLGRLEGGRSFRDEFEGLTRQAHGECGSDCWCNDPEREGEPCPSTPKREPEGVRA